VCVRARAHVWLRVCRGGAGGQTIVLVVNGLSPWRVRFNPRVVHVGSVVHLVTLGQSSV
jgi:hypothetical protein